MKKFPLFNLFIKSFTITITIGGKISIWNGWILVPDWKVENKIIIIIIIIIIIMINK